VPGAVAALRLDAPPLPTGGWIVAASVETLDGTDPGYGERGVDIARNLHWLRNPISAWPFPTLVTFL